MKKLPRNSHLNRKLVALAVVSCFAAGAAFANPTAPTVVNGSASILQSGNLLQITNSPNAIINWGSFSIGASEITRFIQQSQASAVLNRVVGQNPSSILGALQSNGRVFLINPNGILFGAGAQIDVAGLVASTLNLSNADFLAGRLKFTEVAGAGGIVNQGNITTQQGGSVYLVAPDITNSGIINSPKGEVVLAAGKSVELVNPGTPNLRVEITAPDNEARNLGQIVADSGRIGIYAGLINHSGTIRADTAVATEDGRIVLKATKDVTLEAGSVTSASGAKGGSVSIESAAGLTQLAGTIAITGLLSQAEGASSTPSPLTGEGGGGGEGRGGSVTVKADRLISTGSIDASGAVGGTVAIEANRYLGAGVVKASGAAGDGGSVSLLAREYLIQTAAESFTADGGVSGKGGGVTVQAAQRVFSSASLSAQGAGEGQRGGDIKVLADEVMLFGASINASGESGGTVLIGGDYQGKNPDIQNASRTWINYSTTIRADATQRGDGGKVIIWSDQDTRYAGDVSARGGAQSGNGGFIEVSGKDSLIFAGTADAGAANGAPGTVLLDPKNIIIDSAGGGGGVTSFLLLDPNPNTSDQFAQQVVVLSNNNVVATKPFDDFVASNAGAVYLFNGATGALISTLTGSQAGDQVGSDFGVGGSGITALSNGNYVVISPLWNNGATGFTAGAVTFGNGTTGVSGVVSAANSLVGGASNDFVGYGGVTALSNGNYVVSSPFWANGAAAGAGAATFGNGTTGVSGVVSAANSLVGSSANDQVGFNFNIDIGATALSNGNYVVTSPDWNNGAATRAGAATFGNGTTGVTGVVSAANSLVGSTANDQVGGNGVTTLTNGNYVVISPSWNNGAATTAGAATFGNGTTGISGAVTAANSLVGTTASNNVGDGGVTALTNGNYVVSSPSWDDGPTTNVGAVTFGSGTTGISGAVSVANSLVGTTASDSVGSNGVTALSNGNYVVSSPAWDNGAANVGAVTFGNGATGIVGAVSAANSLVGTTANDGVGSSGITALSNGNYVVRSGNWNNGAAASAGAATFGNGTTGISGPVSAANSLVGTTAGDNVGLGSNAVIELSNGNYVVVSGSWDNGASLNAGAATFGSGATGVSGVVSSANSLVSTTPGDGIGVTALTNGNYVVSNSFWNNGAALGAGAATFGNGTTGISGVVSAANSLVGTTTGDAVGGGSVTALSNGNYVVSSPGWDNGAAAGAGAVTFGNGATGIVGAVSAANSLVGTTTLDRVGRGGSGGSSGITALSNGNYVVSSIFWANGAASSAGAVTFGNGSTGISGAVSAANSLVGTIANDQIGSGGVTPLSNGNVVVRSPLADNGAIVNAGLVHVLSPGGGGPFTNPLIFADNAAGTTTITPAQITAITNTGTTVTLQANNDITLNASSPITTSAGGAGGAITMQAGRSILLNSNITSDNGAVTLVANERTANGAVDAQRDPGSAVITVASGTTINAGNANISLTLNDGAGLANSTSGNITLANLTTTGQVLTRNLGPTAGSGIAQQLDSVIAAGSLLAVANNGSVVLDNFTLPTSGHLVTTLAGSANGGFRFANGQTLAVDTVGGTSGLTAAGNMVLTASGSLSDIDFSATGGITTTAAATATLSAGRDIVLRGAISAASGSLGLTFNPANLARTPGGATLTLNGGTGGLTATVNNGKTWRNDGAITMQGASTIRLPNVGGYASFTNAASGVLNVNSTAGWSFISDPSVQGGIVNNAGTINVNNNTSWEAAFTNTGTGNLNIAAGKAVSMQNGQNIAGTVNIGSGGTLWVSERHGANAAFNGTTINGTGTLQVVAGIGPVADFANVNAGAATLLVGSGGTANILSGTSTFGALNMTGGTLKGTGTITGNVNNTGGTVAPGASPGILTINGNYVQGPGGALNMEIGGTTAGTQYDQLIVNGNVALGGTLSTTFINSFAPAVTDTFALVQSSGTVSGTFATTNVVPAGSTFIPGYSVSSVAFAAPAPATVPPVTVPPVTVPPVTVPPVTEPSAGVSLPESQAVLSPQIPATQQIVSALAEPNQVAQDLRQAAIGGVQEEDKPAGPPICR